MVNILQPLLQGERAGQRAAEILGQGLDEATNRYLLSKGIGDVQDMLKSTKEEGKPINPLGLTLDLAKTFSRVPGGLQALSDLAPSIQKEVLRQNLLPPDEEKKDYEFNASLDRQMTPAQRSQKMPEGSIYEGARPGIGSSDEVPPSQDLEPSQQTFINSVKDFLRTTGDINAATDLATKSWETMSAEQQRRFNYQKNAMDILNQKVSENFAQGLSAPFQNELAEQYFNLIETKNPNAAWNQLYPKFRAAQVAEENLKNATGSNRPLIFLGDMDQRINNARASLQPIIDIDPEYGQALAQNYLGYGPAESAKIVRRPQKTFEQFIKQIEPFPEQKRELYVNSKEGSIEKAYKKAIRDWKETTTKKLKQYLEKKFDPQKDSLLVLRSELYDKGYSENAFLDAVNEVFPDATTNPKLSRYNQNEYSKLSEPIIPGMQEIFSLGVKGRSIDQILNSLGRSIQRKR